MPDETTRPSSTLIATDDYRKDNIKEGERQNRAGDEGKRVIVTIVFEKHIPKGNKYLDFLTNGENKNDWHYYIYVSILNI